MEEEWRERENTNGDGVADKVVDFSDLEVEVSAHDTPQDLLKAGDLGAGDGSNRVRKVHGRLDVSTTSHKVELGTFSGTLVAQNLGHDGVLHPRTSSEGREKEERVSLQEPHQR